MANPQTSPKSRRPREESIRMGKEIYKAILPQVERDHHGEYVAIDVDTRQWAIADTTTRRGGRPPRSMPRCRQHPV